MIVVGYVDAAGIGRRLFTLPGRSPCLFKPKEKSAEVIVVVVNEPCQVEQQGGLTKQRRTER
ncbi:MAG: hypothetical protein WKG06_45755 [Segetibacter sp.]